MAGNGLLLVTLQEALLYSLTNRRSNLKLFGGSAFTKEYVFGLKDYNSATWMQNTVASMAGAVASLTVSAPMDVIKTRIQNKNFENPETGYQILKNMIKTEGPTAFFKGLTPKILTVGPKLVFSYIPNVKGDLTVRFAVAQSLIPFFDRVLTGAATI